MDVQTILVWILAVLIFITAYWYLTVPNNLPPGSAGIPIFGYLLFIGPYVHLMFTDLAKKYGSLYHLYLGSRLAIVLNDFASIKEAFVKQGDIFSGRNPDPDFEEINGDFSGVINTDGEYWRQHRRFILHNMRDYGVGKSTIEPLLLDEIQNFLKAVRQQNGDAIQFKDYLSPSLANNIKILVTGKRVDYNHPSIQAIINAFKSIEEVATMLPITTFFPWSKPIMDVIMKKRATVIRKIHITLNEVAENAISDTKNKFVDGQNGNYLQAYLTERNTRLKENKNENIFTELGLIHNTRDLLTAGTDTSATTLAWAALYMAVYPDIQKKVQEEIDQVIGRHREPSYADRINTPYTEATLNEINRVVTLVPLAVVHRPIRDTTLFGYRIPKDTIVFPNIWAVHNDKKLWGDPENFRPERFIGSKGECVKPEYLIPFSIGKRACAGEPLARMELYLYFVSLLQNFNIVPPKDVTLTLEAKPGFTRQPKSILLCVKSRS